MCCCKSDDDANDQPSRMRIMQSVCSLRSFSKCFIEQKTRAISAGMFFALFVTTHRNNFRIDIILIRLFCSSFSVSNKRILFACEQTKNGTNFSRHNRSPQQHPNIWRLTSDHRTDAPYLYYMSAFHETFSNSKPNTNMHT